MKKVVSILAVLGILMSSVNLPAVNAASGETAFNDTFAENVGDWEIGYAASSEGEYTGIAIIQEDGMRQVEIHLAYCKGCKWCMQKT